MNFPNLSKLKGIPPCDEAMDWDKPVSELLKEHVNEQETVSGDSDDETVDNAEPVCSLTEVEDYIDKIESSKKTGCYQT